RALHQLVSHENVDHAPPVAVGTHEILQRQRGLPEELGAALVLQHKELALNSAHRRLGDVAKTLRGLSDLLMRTVAAVASFFSPTGPIASSTPRNSLTSISVTPLSPARRKATLSTPSCTSFRSSMRDSNSGPISVTVARTG